MYDYYLTVNEAFLITEFPVRKWFQWILDQHMSKAHRYHCS